MGEGQGGETSSGRVQEAQSTGQGMIWPKMSTVLRLRPSWTPAPFSPATCPGVLKILVSLSSASEELSFPDLAISADFKNN